MNALGNSYPDIMDVVDKCMALVKDEVNDLDKLNIIICGKSGVGKSTLINSVFREDICETGFGRPVTQEMRRWEREGFPLAIFDTKGFELDKDVQKNIKDGIITAIREGYNKNDIGERIHCIWYCVATPSDRFEDDEAKWLKELAAMPELADVPILVILTKSYSKKQAAKMRDYILEVTPEVAQVVCVLAQDYEMEDDMPPVKAYGLDTLVNVMAGLLPASLQKALANIQKVSLEQKVQVARNVMYGFVSTAITEAAAPIPLADAAMLVPTQITMIAAIATVFGVHIGRNSLVSILSATLGAGGATIIGRNVVSNIFKFFPGIGTAAGIAIGAATAGALTLALGETFIQIMSRVFVGEFEVKDLEGPKGRKLISKIFNTQSKVASESIKSILPNG